MDQQKVFFAGSERKKKAFLDKKKKAQKTTEICIFSKGLVHGICQKIEIF